MLRQKTVNFRRKWECVNVVRIASGASARIKKAGNPKGAARRGAAEGDGDARHT